MADLPRPFLDSERKRALLELLGFEMEADSHYPIDNPAQRLKFSALMELIAGAIADWADVEEEDGVTSFETINDELNDYAQMFLVG